jgi:hypothetical protein
MKLNAQTTSLNGLSLLDEEVVSVLDERTKSLVLDEYQNFEQSKVIILLLEHNDLGGSCSGLGLRPNLLRNS